MTGARLASFRTGDNNETLAQAILSFVAFTTAVPRSEDVGLDFLCVLAEKSGPLFRTGPSFVVQVKSNLDPLSFGVDKKDPKKKKPYECDWLRSQATPFFLGVIDQSKLRLDLYTTWRRHEAFLKHGDASVITLVPGGDGDPSFDTETSEQTIPLGEPAVRLSLSDLVIKKEPDFFALLKAWTDLDQLIINDNHAGIYWTTGPSTHKTNDVSFTQFTQRFFVNGRNLSRTLKLFARTAASLQLELDQVIRERDEYSEQRDALGAVLRNFNGHLEKPARDLLNASGFELTDDPEMHLRQMIRPPGCRPEPARNQSSDGDSKP